MAIIEVWQQRHNNASSNETQHNKPAFDNLFGVLELAEAVFLELPPQQILVNVQRVCRRWQDIVTASLPIQQALFFRPIGMQGPIHFMKVSGEQYGGSWVSPQGSRCPFQIYEHPLVAPLLLHEQQPTRAMDRPEASWRRQLLTQPPVRAVTINVGSDNVTLYAGLEGVTMGNVWTATHLCTPGPLFISNWSSWKGYSNMWRKRSASSSLKALKAVKKPCN
ncbi:hypothetical protein CERZMDRAFT_97330 [Cercospora zeae-maydis SCOH1-5]|uniref:F-box domain-containing protein n=1 Tax=Cercospora zeae-maydis SCOH1-5 TaxID=717836 RepID=A0A6A6FHE0_9PEZI|nr:hypothetical protein CERZMDRAFT_97330 [Cercospora zeae-maydis SCOH1-5]